jgi:hypothetical protein
VTSEPATNLLLLSIAVHSGTRAVVATDESASGGLFEHVCSKRDRRHGRGSQQTFQSKIKEALKKTKHKGQSEIIVTHARRVVSHQVKLGGSKCCVA